MIKDTLIREINKLKKQDFSEIDYLSGRKAYLQAISDIFEMLDTLEAKEVDLEKELESWRYNHFHGRRDKEASGEYLERITQLELAKHFFELGLRVQRGE